METTLSTVVTGFEIHISLWVEDEPSYGYIVDVKAKLETTYGQSLGTIDTDVFEDARNLPLALAKAYVLHRKINKGKIVPSIDSF